MSIETPRKTKGLLQCTRCQNFGHSKTYCNRPFACVKCGQEHNTTTCKKPKDTPATCFLCNGSHPSNYKGCPVYQKMFKQQQANAILRSKTTNTQILKPKVINPTSASPKNFNNSTAFTHNNDFVNSTSYADTVKQQPYNSNLETMMGNLIAEFKSMFQHILDNNNKIMNLLITLINKIH